MIKDFDGEKGNVDLVFDEANQNKDYFNLICDKNYSSSGKLKNVCISVKDSIIVKDVISRGGSKILDGYNPLFSATVVQRLVNNGAIVVGKTTQDEFGFGSFNVNVGKGFSVPKNPFDSERSCGGSSGGGCAFTQNCTGEHISLVESTGGSIACPASFCGVFGFTPTYGLLSRYGLIDYGNSLDKIGFASKYLDNIANILGYCIGKDENDSTSLDVNEKYSIKSLKGLKVGLVSEGFDVDEGVKNVIIEYLDTKKVKYDEVSLDFSYKYGVAAYYIVAMCEASTNLAKYCGMRYGLSDEIKGDFNQYFSKIREEGFGNEAKRRVMLGTFARMVGYRDAYYIKALKVKTMIIKDYKKKFKKYDVLITPTMPFIAPRFDDIKNMSVVDNYMADKLLAGVNLGGFPHLNVPVGFLNKMPVGMLVIADHLMEKNLFRGWL